MIHSPTSLRLCSVTYLLIHKDKNGLNWVDETNKMVSPVNFNWNHSYQTSWQHNYYNIKQMKLRQDLTFCSCKVDKLFNLVEEDMCWHLLFLEFVQLQQGYSCKDSSLDQVHYANKCIVIYYTIHLKNHANCAIKKHEHWLSHLYYMMHSKMKKVRNSFSSLL